MRKNRKIPKKMSVMAKTTMRFGLIIMVFFVMVILNFLSNSSCTQLLKTKGELEREIVKYENIRMREATRWEEMKTPEKIERALLGCGLSMRFPHSIQIVRMMDNGRPRPGQYSVAEAKRRNYGTAAKVVPSERPSGRSAVRR